VSYSLLRLRRLQKRKRQRVTALHTCRYSIRAHFSRGAGTGAERAPAPRMRAMYSAGSSSGMSQSARRGTLNSVSSASNDIVAKVVIQYMKRLQSPACVRKLPERRRHARSSRETMYRGSSRPGGGCSRGSRRTSKSRNLNQCGHGHAKCADLLLRPSSRRTSVPFGTSSHRSGSQHSLFRDEIAALIVLMKARRRWPRKTSAALTCYTGGVE
jgi:hypothetical protein